VFSNDEEVVKKVASGLFILCLFLVTDGGQGVYGGIVRGTGLQRWGKLIFFFHKTVTDWISLGAAINLVAYYIIGLPIAGLLAFVFHKGINGLWIGLQVSSYASFMCFIILTNVFVNWEKISKEAREVLVGDSANFEKLPDFEVIAEGEENHIDENDRQELSEDEEEMQDMSIQ